MKSFVDLPATLSGQPLAIGVMLADVDSGRGREALFADQTPELLQGLADQTRVSSIRASTAIEGIDVDPDRALGLAATPPVRVRNRNEREFAGYRDAIDELMSAEVPEPLSLPFVLHLHRLLYRHTDGRGGNLKSEDNEIVVYDEDGRRRVIFRPVSAQDTPFMLTELIERYEGARADRAAHPLLLTGLLILDLLAIHPVADGNGRLARLVTTRELLRAGYGVARHVSIEQRIYDSRNAYYQALRDSQAGWHDATHDPWPWLTYLISVLADAYAAFEARVAAARGLDGLSKQEIVRRHVLAMAPGRTFRLRDLRGSLPRISDPTIRLSLVSLRNEGAVAPEGHGAGAFWTRLGPPAA